MAFYIIGGLVLVALIVILVRKASRGGGNASAHSHHDEDMWTGHSDKMSENEKSSHTSAEADSNKG